MLHSRAYGWQSAGQMFAPTFMRHMYDYGTKPEQVAMVKVVHSEHASNNPKAYYKKRYTVDDVLSSRIICKPLHLLDCCVETDNATAIIVTRADRAKDMRHTPALIRGIVGRCSKPRMDMHYQAGPIDRVAGYYAKDILWPNAGVGPEDIDAIGAYDAFTFTSMLQLEDYGFCKKGEGGDYVSSGITRLGGRRPNNTSGGHLCEGYTHGMNMVIENVRQLRHDVDDSCPIGPDGKRQHTYDYREGGCRQVKDIEVTANLGWANPMTGIRHGHAARLKGGNDHVHSRQLSRNVAVHRRPGRGKRRPTSSIARRTIFICRNATTASCCAIRRPPAVPWCASPKATWTAVEGKGEVHSYEEVHHAIQPAFKGHTPYMVLLVDLDTQKGQPSEHEALRVVGNLTTPDGDAGAAGHGAAGGHRHAGADGVQRRRPRAVAAAVDDRH